MGMAPPIITPVIRHNDNNVILGNRNILFASIPDLLWQFFDRLLLNHRKMRETDTNCSNGKRKKGKVGRFWVIVAAIIHFWFSCNIVLPCVVNSDFSQSSIVYRLCYLSFQESKSASSWNGEEVKLKTRKWSSQGREKWVKII